jgi:menaquinone-9 beta-reductase
MAAAGTGSAPVARHTAVVDLDVEVLVVGGGPAGAAAGYWLARHGHDVAIVEKRTYPRDKTCGDGLTPRSIYELGEMGLAEELSHYHRTDGLRVTGVGRTIELDWPSHPKFPQYGAVVRRTELDWMVARNAESAGATLLQGHEAVAPLMDRGFVRGAIVRVNGATSTSEIRANYVVVADGANSRFGRALGTFRSRDMPYGTAIRSYWESPMHGDSWIESALDITDRSGSPLPGYGWIFPAGDGTVNLGVGLLSTFRDFKSVNTTMLLESYAHMVAERWGLNPEQPIAKPVSGRIPMGGSVGPKIGPTYLVIGDAAGAVNPFNGEGIDYAYETARMAADVLHQAISENDPVALQTYGKLFDAEYAQYFKVARLFAKVIGRPAVMRELTRTGMHSRTLMEWVLRIMSNLLRPDEIGPAEAAYKAAAKIVRLVPNA